nr:hypothetical protein [Sicyoidochytrium minutum DNA virus]
MEGVLHFEKFPEIKEFKFEETDAFGVDWVGYYPREETSSIYQTVAYDENGEKVGTVLQGPPMIFRIARRNFGNDQTATTYKLLFEPGDCVKHLHARIAMFSDTRWIGKTTNGKIMYDLFSRIERAAKSYLSGYVDKYKPFVRTNGLREWIFNGSKFENGEDDQGKGDGFRIYFKPKSGSDVNVFDVSGKPIYGMTLEQMDSSTVIPLFDLPHFPVSSGTAIVGVGLVHVHQVMLVKKKDGSPFDSDRLCGINTSLVDFGEPKHDVDGDGDDKGEGEQL